MRLLHTSDWHLGHSLRDWPREPEHGRFLSWLLDTLEAERVDALLVTGDIFDTSNPSALAQTMWYRFLSEARGRMPALQILALAGNHDSAARLEAPGAILRGLAIHVVGAVGRDEGRLLVEPLLVPLRDRSGSVRAWVGVVPFLRPSDLAGATGPEAAADPLVAGVQRVYDEVHEAIRRRREPGQAIVGTGHLYMVGGALSELSERKILGGNQHALPPTLFGPDVAYAALGHLHLAQRVGGREQVRYAGSPLPLSMTEAGYVHQVVIVDLEGEHLAGIRPLPVPRTVPMIRVPAAGAGLLEDVLLALRQLEAPASLPEDRWPFLEVTVALLQPVPGLVRQVEEALVGKGVRLVRVGRVNQGSGGALGEAVTQTSLRDLTPEQVFRERYARDHAGEPPASILEAFHELLAEASERRGAP